MYVYIYRIGFKKRIYRVEVKKSDPPFFGSRIAIAAYLGKVIHNCESLFAIYSHFCTLCIKFF